MFIVEEEIKPNKWHEHPVQFKDVDAAEAFVSNPEAKPKVNHIDGNNRNNSFTNLEWVSDEENKARAMELRSHANRTN